MIRRIVQILILGFLCWGCGKGNSSGLSVGINPSSPILMAFTSTTGGSTTGPTPPYFEINSLKLTWAGGSAFQLLALTFYSNTTTSSSSSGSSQTSFGCGAAAGAISSIFANINVFDCNNSSVGPAIDSNGNLTIPAPKTPGCANHVQSTAFFCDSLPITVNSNPTASYNIPVQAVIFGESLDSSGNVTGRVNGFANIILH